MKVSAHPLIVAAALGLLGPAALADDRSEDEERASSARCHRAGAQRSPVAPDQAPTPEEFARVERRWRAAVLARDEADGW